MEKPVKIISDELMFQINKQLKHEVENIVRDIVKEEVDRAIKNIDFADEVDAHNLVYDELQSMDLIDHIDPSDLDGKISDALEDFLPQLTISKGT